MDSDGWLIWLMNFESGLILNFGRRLLTDPPKKNIDCSKFCIYLNFRYSIIWTFRTLYVFQNQLQNTRGALWSWSYGSWIYNYLCNQCISPVKLWFWIPLMERFTRFTTLCDKVCQWLATGRWFSLGSPVSSTNKTEILLKVSLNTIKPNQPKH